MAAYPHDYDDGERDRCIRITSATETITVIEDCENGAAWIRSERAVPVER